jgi:para-aminobenzoate synthetase component 1
MQSSQKTKLNSGILEKFLLQKDHTFVQQLNDWGGRRIPFVFIIDFQGQKPLAWTTDELDNQKIAFDLNGFSNAASTPDTQPPQIRFNKFPVSFEEYKEKFDHVVANIKAGNSFLVNLSAPTPIECNLSLDEIFRYSKALYRFRYKDEFVCFSPEMFVRITNNQISSFPMKGTIDASLPDAEEQILNDPKEKAEHATIVDLIRNDLSRVAEKVWVKRYRYIDRVQTHQKTLLQVSSEVAGLLPASFNRAFGDLLVELLPAGSISGAPKPKTLNIIDEAENYDRGYYTGIVGYFDGTTFESAVMIRFVEKQNGQLIFKSGGGITSRSTAHSEYQELIDKVYLPIPHASILP